jgi:alcohol dehydrogenase
VYDPADRSLRVREFALPKPQPDQVVVRVITSAICGSDLHTFLGRRTPAKPLILGHESCGTIVHLGREVQQDAAGEPLALGDRVTWSIAASCGHCFFCGDGLPQKCDALVKYGHQPADSRPSLTGGFAEFIYLAPGSALYRVPDTLHSNTVVFANCAMATVAAAHRMANVQAGEAVLIQGAGLLGLCAAAMAAVAGARCVLVTDAVPQRLQLATEFGATHTLQVDQDKPEQLTELASEIAEPHGFDAAIEVSGQPQAVASGLRALRVGARYVLVGCVFPGAEAHLDLYTITTRMLRLSGLHNYRPGDLLTAIRFLQLYGERFPFQTVVAKEFPLHEIAEAFQHAIQHRDVLRVAVVPTPEGDSG